MLEVNITYLLSGNYLLKGKIKTCSLQREGARGAILPKVVKLEDPLTSLSSWGSHELRLMRSS